MIDGAELNRLMQKVFLTKAEVAAVFGTTDRAIQRAIDRNEIEVVELGPRIKRIPTSCIAKKIRREPLAA